MPFKDFLSGAVAAACSVERNHLCNFEREHHVKHMKFGPVVQEEMSFKKKFTDGQKDARRTKAYHNSPP